MIVYGEMLSLASSKRKDFPMTSSRIISTLWVWGEHVNEIPML